MNTNSVKGSSYCTETRCLSEPIQRASVSPRHKHQRKGEENQLYDHLTVRAAIYNETQTIPHIAEFRASADTRMSKAKTGQTAPDVLDDNGEIARNIRDDLENASGQLRERY